MTRQEIVAKLAQEGIVEQMCANIAHVRELTPDLKDLAQTIYLVLLEYDEEKIVDLWESNAIGFFIARIAANQYNSKTSPFYKLFRPSQGKRAHILPPRWMRGFSAMPDLRKLSLASPSRATAWRMR